jgi:hypothetical protein
MLLSRVLKHDMAFAHPVPMSTPVLTRQVGPSEHKSGSTRNPFDSYLACGVRNGGSWPWRANGSPAILLLSVRAKEESTQRLAWVRSLQRHGGDRRAAHPESVAVGGWLFQRGRVHAWPVRFGFWMPCVRTGL